MGITTTLAKWKPLHQSRDTSSLLHPFSGFIIILLDNALFGVNALTLGLSTPMTALTGFVAAFILVIVFQRALDGNSLQTCMAKGIFAGIVTGIPTSIAGTTFGGLILVWAGIDRLLRKNK